MAKKGEYPRPYATSAQAALELFVRRVCDETGVPDKKINPHVAKRLGISAPLVSKLRTGAQQMQLATVLRLAEILGGTPDDVLLRAGSVTQRSPVPQARSTVRTKAG